MSTCDKGRSREGEREEKGERGAGDKGRTVEAQEAVWRRRWHGLPVGRHAGGVKVADCQRGESILRCSCDHALVWAV